jgi:epoxyqueuosine reductase
MLHFSFDIVQLAADIKRWGRELGFQQVGITDTDLSQAEQRLQEWLAKGFHGEMKYMEAYGTKRSRPAELVPGTLRIISVRMDYLPPDARMIETLQDPEKAYVARYALGRDYHKLIRKRLQELAEKIQSVVGEFGYRAFTDSAPVMEKPLGEKAGLGWIGKNTNLINSKAGSWFFLGELYTDLPLPVDEVATNHCGSCRACLDICPTKAFVGPYQLDARRCIAYLTIEFRGVIPEELRPLMGNRVYGCDDCQFICPWNKFARATQEGDFRPRHNLDSADLITVFEWSEEEFLQKTAGSAIRRIGYECWLRNIAIGLGNAPTKPAIIAALEKRRNYPSALVREHVEWALTQQLGKPR